MTYNVFGGTLSLTQSISLFRELTLGSETGVIRWQDEKYETAFLPHCKN